MSPGSKGLDLAPAPRHWPDWRWPEASYTGCSEHRGQSEPTRTDTVPEVALERVLSLMHLGGHRTPPPPVIPTLGDPEPFLPLLGYRLGTLWVQADQVPLWLQVFLFQGLGYVSELAVSAASAGMYCGRQTWIVSTRAHLFFLGVGDICLHVTPAILESYASCFYVNSTQAGVIGKEGTSIEEKPLRFSCKTFS